jgi:GNAT superfamily N-acetyltransferase
MSLQIRPATLADSPAVQRLAGQLGYPMDIGALRSRLAAVLASPGQELLVAEVERSVSGWVYLLAGPDLLTGPTAEIGGLVVDESRRGQGIGKALLDQAWAWAGQHGYTELRVRSNTAREPYVKAFYLAAGFEVVKTQWVLRRRPTADGRLRTEDQ